MYIRTQNRKTDAQVIPSGGQVPQMNINSDLTELNIQMGPSLPLLRLSHILLWSHYPILCGLSEFPIKLDQKFKCYDFKTGSKIKRTITKMSQQLLFQKWIKMRFKKSKLVRKWIKMHQKCIKIVSKAIKMDQKSFECIKNVKKRIKMHQLWKLIWSKM